MAAEQQLLVFIIAFRDPNISRSSSPKNEHSVIIYTPSCQSRPVIIMKVN